MISKSLFEHHYRTRSKEKIRSKLRSRVKQSGDNLTSKEERSSRVDNNVSVTESSANGTESKTKQRLSVALH
jgi:hypothetical protein